ncbi:loganic acid O-methyltransferase-like [Argentina anserina]|uniref:loganic acid O-methyltransferase-like n=1 Tax=Argentina anserina TaxID=57926 RepID=UPI00217631A7|nr:loganic acid O-methyltransferase-like [Potentilla anserina]
MIKIVEESNKKEMATRVNGADCFYSYSKNSSFQRNAIDAAKELIKEAVFSKLDIACLSSSNTFRVTDLGCSMGPNTFLAVQNILEAVENKYRTQWRNSEVPDFQVFFSDQAANDFNELFQSLPPDRNYFAMGVPGSFYSRLFPKAHLHFVYSSFSLQCLSKVPEEVLDRNSPAWNKGRAHYSNSAHQVVEAYSAQYARDMGCFLNARAQEIVEGGLMAFVVPGRPNGTPHAQNYYNMTLDLFGSCLLDMAKKGVIAEDKVDSFNLPMYNASLDEVEAIVKYNGCFSIERMENLPQEKLQPNVFRSTVRAGMENIVRANFGEDILDEFFDSLNKKYEESTSVLESVTAVSLFVLLKRHSK